MPSPLIGLTASHGKSLGHPTSYVMEAYVQALERAGALPVLVPLGLPEAALAGILGRLDGLLFTGGGDVDPDRYRSQDHPLLSNVDGERDRTELALFECVRRAGLPYLGICRGLQLINVALGGSLYEDVLDQRPGALRHQFGEGYKPRDFLAHAVTVDPGSRLASITGSTGEQVNSLHHQGIRELAPGLRAAAFAPDGLVEAIEDPAAPFALAVQWHPEWLPERPVSAAIFEAFIAAAKET